MSSALTLPSNTKRCSRCGSRKPVSLFHKSRRSKDGHNTACKACIAREQARFRKTIPYWWGRYRWFIKAAPTMDEKWRKRRCRELTVKAIRLGIIKRPDYCQCCYGRLTVDAHHDDYCDPLKIQWACRACHKRADKAREARLGIVRRSHPFRRIPQSTHREAWRLWTTGKYSQVAIGRMLGIHNSTVSKLVRGLL